MLMARNSHSAIVRKIKSTLLAKKFGVSNILSFYIFVSECIFVSEYLFTFDVVMIPSILLGPVLMLKNPSSLPWMMVNFATEFAVKGSSLSVTSNLATISSALFSCTVLAYCQNTHKQAVL